MEKLLLQEHESKQLRVERHSLKVGLDAANMTLDRMENEAATIKQRLKEQENLDCKDINAINGGNQIVGQVIFYLRNYLRNETSYKVILNYNINIEVDFHSHKSNKMFYRRACITFPESSQVLQSLTQNYY